MATKYCFMNKERVCDLTCKAAFPVEDAVDPVDCYFIWLAATFGEGLFDLRKMTESMGGPGAGLGGLGGFPGSGGPGGPSSSGPVSGN